VCTSSIASSSCLGAVAASSAASLRRLNPNQVEGSSPTCACCATASARAAGYTVFGLLLHACGMCRPAAKGRSCQAMRDWVCASDQVLGSSLHVGTDFQLTCWSLRALCVCSCLNACTSSCMLRCRGSVTAVVLLCAFDDASTADV
jgi:hypothetical protein